ncbi:MAG: hypothetical protein IT370_34650 [Deltaproteobacteria bacterium]|nr:hypothetical protein [Deltaproteobacteria bacterium]
MARSRKLLTLAGGVALGVALAATACEARPRGRSTTRPSATRVAPRPASTRPPAPVPALVTTGTTTPDGGQGSAGATTTTPAATPARPRVGADGRPAAGNVVGRSLPSQ